MTLPLVPLLIDGQFGPGAQGQSLPVVNPATEEAIATLAHAAPEDLDRALLAADRAFALWRQTTAAERHAVQFGPHGPNGLRSELGEDYLPPYP